MRPASIRRRETGAGPVRVLHLFFYLDRGGDELVTLDLIERTDPGGIQQDVVELGSRPGVLTDRFRAAGARTLRCPIAPLPTFPFRLWRLLRSERPQVVVAHLGLLAGLPVAIARLAGLPTRVVRLASEGDAWPDTTAYRGVRAVLRLLIRHNATAVLGVSRAALALGRPPAGDERYRVLYNSVDPGRLTGGSRAAARREWGISDDAPVIAHLGRAIACKNRPFVLQVHRELRRSRPDAVLLMAGGGGIDDLTSAEPGCTDDSSIRLLGELDSVRDVLAAADLLVLPSRREGLPGVVLEALSVGVPCLVSDLPSLREVAATVQGVHLLAVDRGAAAWAVAAQQLTAPEAADGAAIAESLGGSPFLHDAAVRNWRREWVGIDRDSGPAVLGKSADSMDVS